MNWKAHQFSLSSYEGENANEKTQDEDGEMIDVGKK